MSCKIDYLDDGKIDENADYNKFSRINSTVLSTSSEMARENFGPAGGVIYDVSMSFIDNTITRVMDVALPGLGMVTMASGSFADSVISGKERGLSDEKALGLGAVAGTMEYVTEKVGLEKLLSIKNPNTLLKELRSAARTEVGEETLGFFVNEVFDLLVSQDKSEWQTAINGYVLEGKTKNEAMALATMDRAEELGKTALSSYLTSFFTGGTRATRIAIQNYCRNLQIESGLGKSLRSGGDENMDAFIHAGLQSGENTQAHRLAQSLQQKLQNDTVSDREIGRTCLAIVQELDRENSSGKVPNGNFQQETGQLQSPETAGERDWTRLYESAAKYGVPTEKVNRVQRIASLFGSEVEFYSAENPLQNGFYSSDGVLHINANSQNPVAQIFGHELTHSLEKTGSYGKLQQLVFDRIAQTGEDLTQLREKKKADYAEQKVVLDDQGVDREITAAYMENLLTDEAAIRSLVRGDKKIGQRFLDWIDRILAKLGNENAQERAFLARARQMYSAALQENQDTASKTRQADGAVAQFSISETDDGRAVAVVDNDILSHLDTTAWDKTKKEQAKAAAKEAMLAFKDGVQVNGITYKVNRTSRREYTRSNDTERSYRKTPDTFADKMRAAANTDDIITATTSWANDGGIRHPRDDNFVDFAHGEVLIQAGQNQYEAETVVGITKEGEYVFYDVGDMKPTSFKTIEEPSTTASNTNAVSDIQEDSPNDSIPISQRDVNDLHNWGDLRELELPMFNPEDAPYIPGREPQSLNDSADLRELQLPMFLADEESNGSDNENQYSFGGEHAKKRDQSMLETAIALEAEGEDNEAIRRETGWFRGMDGKWRFEIDDSRMKLKNFDPDKGADEIQQAMDRLIDAQEDLIDKSEISEEQLAMVREYKKARKTDPARAEELYRQLSESNVGEQFRKSIAAQEEYDAAKEKNGLTLGDVITHPTLFRNYPELREIPIKFPRISGDRGSYDGESICLSKNLMEEPEELRASLLHEIQHAVQDREGFAGGSSPEYWREKLEDGYSRRWNIEGRESEREMGSWDLYSSTAGEIEARNVSDRMHLSPEERLNIPPDLGDENTVFAEDDGQNTLWAEEPGVPAENGEELFTSSFIRDIFNPQLVSGAVNPHGRRADKHAKRYYEEVRHMSTDVSKIAAVTGYSQEQIQTIKNFIFIEEHDLGDRIGRFDPDFMMAESWQRLALGKPEPHDLTLIRHEIMERDLMLQGLTQDEAHTRTSAVYNYKEEAYQFYAQIKKFAKE